MPVHGVNRRNAAIDPPPRHSVASTLQRAQLNAISRMRPRQGPGLGKINLQTRNSIALFCIWVPLRRRCVKCRVVFTSTHATPRSKDQASRCTQYSCECEDTRRFLVNADVCFLLYVIDSRCFSPPRPRPPHVICHDNRSTCTLNG